MRIDKFLNSVNLTKRRSIAEDMLANKVIYLNNIIVKKAKEVKVGDIIKMQYLEYDEEYKILQIPKIKSTPKSAQGEYVCKIN
jgi:ribosomal 50S subunit-recycling heat shock protein